MMNDSTRTAAADGEPGRLQAITGDPQADEALARLAALGDPPDRGHVEAYEHVYERLRGLLGDLDKVAPGTAAAQAAGPSAPRAHAASHDHLDGQAEQA
jgi:hypothetical protein